MDDRKDYFIPPPPDGVSGSARSQLVSSHYLSRPPVKKGELPIYDGTAKEQQQVQQDQGAAPEHREHHSQMSPLSKLKLPKIAFRNTDAQNKPVEPLESIVSDVESEQEEEEDKLTGLDDSFIDRELEKLVFRYGAYTPNKIDTSQVPRPKSDIIYSATKDGDKISSPVSSFIEQKAVDRGVCQDKFVQTTLREVPLYGDTLNRIKIPLVTIVQPFSEEVEKKVPLIDLVAAIGEREPSKQNLIRCPKCRAYVNPAMEGDSRLDYRICNFCYKGFTLTQQEFLALGSLKGKVGGRVKVPPIMRGSVDFVAPLKYYTPIEEEETSIGATLNSLIQKATALSTSIPIGSGRNSEQNYIAYSTYGVNGADSPSSINTDSSTPLSRRDSTTSSVLRRGSSYVPSMHFSINNGDQSLSEEYNNVPSYVIVVDSTAASSGMSLRNCILNSLREALQECTKTKTRVSFCVITFDCVVYLYDPRNKLFQINIMTEIDEPYSPGCAEELFVHFDGTDMSEVNRYIDFIMNNTMTPTGSLSCGNAALAVGVSLLADSKLPGTVSIFYSQPPEVGIGKCVKADLAQEFSIDESMKLLYDELAQKCYENGIAVDVYICPKRERMPGDIQVQYMCQQTAGNSWYFSSFNSHYDAAKFTNNFIRLFTVLHAYNCELKLRASKPLEITENHCPFHNTRSVIDTSGLRVPRLSPDTAISFTMTMDDIVNDKRDLYVQLACMYNSSLDGRKLVRVHTQSIKVSTNINNIYKSANCKALLNHYARKLAYNMMRTGTNARRAILDELIAALSTYRRLCVPSTPANQLILPDNLKLLPAMLNSLFKMYTGNDQGFEFLQKMMRSLLSPVDETAYIYSRVYCLHRSVYDAYQDAPRGGWKFSRNTVAASTSQIFSDGIYLIDDGYKLVLYFGPHVKWALLQQLFGEDLLLDDKSAKTLQVREDTETGRNLLELIQAVRNAHRGSHFLNLKILPYCSQQHRLLKLLLLEDESGGEPSYINFLVKVHRLIRQTQENMLA